MSTDLTLMELIRRVRQGDEQAVAELVRRYEPETKTQDRPIVAEEQGEAPGA